MNTSPKKGNMIFCTPPMMDAPLRELFVRVFKSAVALSVSREINCVCIRTGRPISSCITLNHTVLVALILSAPSKLGAESMVLARRPFHKGYVFIGHPIRSRPPKLMTTVSGCWLSTPLTHMNSCRNRRLRYATMHARVSGGLRHVRVRGSLSSLLSPNC